MSIKFFNNNNNNNQDEIHINKRSKLEDPQESEVTFDTKKVESEEKCKPGITAVSDVLQGDANAVMNVCVRITLHGAEETILSKGKTLRKQEAIFIYLFIYLALPTRAGSPQQHMPITVGPFCLTHPVNFPCGRKPEYPEETHDFRQSVDFYSFHMRTGFESHWESSH
jgi:hypothetical protein